MAGHIGKYEILRILGEGAMGKVFLGRDPSLGREVAIKTIRPESSFGEEARLRFDREARAAGALNHPNLVTIHEFGEDEGTLFIAMEYLPGEDLQALLRQNRLSPLEILEVIAQVCDGLAYAHSRGVMHRDIKPSNVQVFQEMGRLHAKVMDFGIARITDSDMTGTGTLLGTFGYMAPEYIQTGVPDSRSDLFAVGVVLYEALSGQRPFNGDTMATVLYRIIHDQPKPLDSAHLRGISPKVTAILRRALAKDPARRFQTAQELAAALREAKDPAWPGFLDMEGAATVLSERLELPPRPSEKAQPHPRLKGWIVGAGLLLLGAGGALAWVRWATPRPEPPVQLPASAPVSISVQAPVPSVSPMAQPKPTQEKTAEPAPSEPPIALPKAAPPAPQPSTPLLAPPTQTSAEPLNEAFNYLDTHPQQALVICQKALAQEPGNLRAHALRAVALYRLERYGPMGEAIKEAKRMGIQPREMMRIPKFAEMVAEELRMRRMPEDQPLHLFQKGGPDRKERPRPPRRRQP